MTGPDENRKIYRVYYRKESAYHESGRWGVPRLTVNDIPTTHIFVKEVEARNRGDVYWQMQGEIWSPNGEARDLIVSLGLRHTSMSAGDVIQEDNGAYWECCLLGWQEVRGVEAEER